MKHIWSFPIQNGRFVDDNDVPSYHSHDGTDSVDFAIPEGTPIYAITDGKIFLTRKDRNYNTWYGGSTTETGNCIVIEFQNLGETYYATYMHLKTVDVNEGDIVKNGQVIGTSGNTGYSSGPHLHLQIRKGTWYGSDVSRIWTDREEFRLTPPSNPCGFLNKLFRYLKVKEVNGNFPVETSLIPTSKMANYYSQKLDESLITDYELSVMCQLCRDELGDIGDKQTQLMNFGVYAKLLRSVYFLRGRNGESIITTLKRDGGFSGWGGRGYPTLSSSYSYPTEIKDYVYNNLMNGNIYNLQGKFYQIASCYPFQNFGYSGYGYGPYRSIETELENKIVNREIRSHITINSGPTRLIGCIANTGFFTASDAVSNINNYPENKILISQF